MSRHAHPPTYRHPHLTRTLPPDLALTHLDSFLSQTATKPHLHPDSYLSTSGIQFPAHAGPQGGLALHHLRRIAAGLRGENLGVETEDAIKAFTEEDLPEADDSRVDAVISRGHSHMNGAGKKRKRAREEEIAEWAETSSQLGVAVQELESFVNTPVHYSSAGADDLWDGAQDLEEYEAQQAVLYGEVGGEEREGAGVVQQGGKAPGLVINGDGKGGISEKDKQARKAAKKARRLDEKRERAGKGKG